jgi:hypothetical protein
VTAAGIAVFLETLAIAVGVALCRAAARADERGYLNRDIPRELREAEQIAREWRRRRIMDF